MSSQVVISYEKNPNPLLSSPRHRNHYDEQSNLTNESANSHVSTAIEHPNKPDDTAEQRSGNDDEQNDNGVTRGCPAPSNMNNSTSSFLEIQQETFKFCY